MRIALVALFGLGLVLPLAADDSAALGYDSKLYQFATGANEEGGRLRVFLYMYSKTWLNGVRQSDDTYDLLLKPGDVVESFVCGDFTDVRRFRLESLSPTQAVFTLEYYDAIRTQLDENTRQYRRGRLRSHERFTLDLTKPNGLLVDYGMNHVELLGRPTARSKD